MIPQPVKWVGAVLALVILVLVVAPIAIEALLGTVSFSDDGGLLGGGDDETTDEDATDEEADAEAPEAAGAGEDGDGVDEEGGDDDAGGEGGADDTRESYQVQSGDTLYSIAEEVYGDGNRWREIAEANDIGDRTTVTVGQELVIP